MVCEELAYGEGEAVRMKALAAGTCERNFPRSVPMGNLTVMLSLIALAQKGLC